MNFGDVNVIMSGETFLWFAGYWLFEALRGFGRLVAFYRALLYPDEFAPALSVMLHNDLLLTGS